jgi:uncharacterized membrane protein YhaH (DUF805 family)
MQRDAPIMENPYAAPRGQILTPTGNQAPLTWKQILFSFEGRIPRRVFWGVNVVMNIIGFILGFVMGLAIGEEAAMIPVLLLNIPMIWVGLAISVKRWHDRDKSGWMVLIILIPIIGALWALVECGFLRGTVGPNKYGEDPT